MNGDRNTPGASSASSTKQSFPLTSNRTSPFQSTTGPAPNTVMAASAFMPPAKPYRSNGASQPSYPPLSMPAAHPYDRSDTAKPTPVGNPFTVGVTAILIRRLPVNTSEEQLRLMLVWAEDLVDVEVLPTEHSEDTGFRCAILKFRTPVGAQKAKDILDGKMNVSKDAEMIVQILTGTTATSRRHGAEKGPNGPSSTTSSNGSSGQPSRQPSRFNGAYQSMDKLSPPMGSGVYSGTELPNPETSNHYQSLFSPQSPIGNHLTDSNRMSSGKSLIKNDSPEDDETGELLKDPVAYAESDANAAQRRAAPSQAPLARMANLSLSTTSPTPSIAPYSHHGMTPLSAHTSTMSPIMSGWPSAGYPAGHHYGRHNFPPVNPADQNPPCNTLYVGNLPVDTSEEELKAMFSKQRGYKRLCFRTKQNGPMCFVEFEDISFATKALHELYGHPLHNSVKGGIRLSFSKNPLGVRSGQNTAQNNPGPANAMGAGLGGHGNGFSTASGPPPGLSAPPGLAMNRMYGNGPSTMASGMYHPNGFSNNPWNGSMYNSSMGGAAPSMVGGGLPSPHPAHMMGR